MSEATVLISTTERYLASAFEDLDLALRTLYRLRQKLGPDGVDNLHIAERLMPIVDDMAGFHMQKAANLWDFKHSLERIVEKIKLEEDV